MSFVLLASVFVIATCGLVYELIAGTLASYLLGDSVTQFSTIIGTYLSSMGIGSFLSRGIRRNLLGVFVQVEILVGLVGGTSAALLFLAFDRIAFFRVLLYAVVGTTGTLVGLEIPLLLRILKDRIEFKDLVSQVFTFDYVGALLASLLFPLVLVPHLGLVRSSFLFGILNVAVALWTLFLFREEIPFLRLLRGSAAAALALLAAGFYFSETLVSAAEAAAYEGKIFYAASSPYQRIVLTALRGDLRLYLNGNLQFSSKDEYRYHEALIHPALAAHPAPRRGLVLGGGDGLALREILKYPAVEKATLVDLDPAVTGLFSSQKNLVALNGGSLRSPRAELVTDDAFQWLRRTQETFNFAIVDLPDPSNFSLGKLYSTAFFRELHRVLDANGSAVVQATSPFVARKSFWCIEKTLRASGFETLPYHAHVPSFGEWGFLLATKKPFAPGTAYPPGLKFLSPDTFSAMTFFPPDMSPLETDVNRLNNQILVRYFEDEWAAYLP
ncbi:MAG: polyamine aminopropyltransferase [Bdellovibrionota bacterium]